MVMRVLISGRVKQRGIMTTYARTTPSLKGKTK